MVAVLAWHGLHVIDLLVGMARPKPGQRPWHPRWMGYGAIRASDKEDVQGESTGGVIDKETGCFLWQRQPRARAVVALVFLALMGVAVQAGVWLLASRAKGGVEAVGPTLLLISHNFLFSGLILCHTSLLAVRASPWPLSRHTTPCCVKPAPHDSPHRQLLPCPLLDSPS